MSEQRHAYGWKPSLPDFRDHQADATGLVVAKEVDPRSDLPAVFDQGSLGSCTANAVTAAVQYHHDLDGPDPGELSRLWVYWFERKLEGSPPDQDTGAYGRDGFKTAYRWGVPSENSWPYVIDDFDDEPPSSLVSEARAHRIPNYKSVHRNVDEWKAVLSNRQTIAFGFTVFESFESRTVERTGIVPMPNRYEEVLGGHEVLAVGYLADEPNYVLCRNSWGTSWGIDGYFLMPWAYILSRGLSGDFITIRRPAGA